MVDRNELLKKVAPCSLMCHTCSAYVDGIICDSSKTLLHYLSGMREFYEKHIPDAAENYERFEKLLKRYGSGPCAGCRSSEHNGCSIEGCFLLECTKTHHVDFCGECKEFPCDRTRIIFEDEVYEKWLNGNRQIKEHGILYYWETNCITPHYEAYKK